MKNKILSIILCLAMLVSCFTLYTYATDIVIDLGPLFEDDDDTTTTPDTDDNKGETTTPDTDDNKGETTTPDTDDNKGETTTPDTDDNKGETTTPDTDDNKGETTTPDTGNNNSGNSGNSSNSGNGGTVTIPPSDDKKDDDKKDDDNKEEVKDDEKKEEKPVWVNPFADVKESDWFYNSVKYVNENGIVNGITDTTFEPNTSLTRGMLVTLLYRVAGSPEISAQSRFTDVISTEWYAKPVAWASAKGIVNGVTTTTFEPNSKITREQIAAIIYRYAKYAGVDVSVGESTNILSYTDVSSVSSYAIEALQFTVGSGVLKGQTESTLNPQNFATRAEAATVIARFAALGK